MEFREDQVRFVADIQAELPRGRNVLGVAPTGFGKGDVLVHFLRLEAERGGHALLCVHLGELVRDTAERLRVAGVPCRVLLGSEPEGPADARVTVASWATLAARRTTLPVTLIVADEAHRSAARTYRAVLARHPGVPLLGFTATGSRSDGRGLRDAGYDELVSAPQIAELVAAGTLAPVTVFAPDEATEGLSEDPVEAWRRLAGDRPGVVFCSTLEQSRELAQRLTAAGYRAAHVDGDTPRAERRRILSGFAAGTIDIVVNKRLICDGLNVPRAKCIMLASRFSHPGPYLQAIGRGRRPGSACVVIDLYGNIHLHGHPDETRWYALDAQAVRRDDEEPVAAVQCRRCLAWGLGGACQNCGSVLPPPAPPKLTKRELKEIRQAAAPRTGPAWALWQRLCREQRDRNLKPQYAALAFRNMHRRWPQWTVAIGLEE